MPEPKPAIQKDLLAGRQYYFLEQNGAFSCVLYGLEQKRWHDAVGTLIQLASACAHHGQTSSHRSAWNPATRRGTQK